LVRVGFSRFDVLNHGWPADLESGLDVEEWPTVA
jgi:hypothetical protein